MTYNKRLSKSERKLIKVARKSVKTAKKSGVGTIESTKFLNAVKR